MKPNFNYLGLLSLLALISVLGWFTGNDGLYGFFGFFYYIRYFWVIPDELFQFNVRRAATFAFFVELLSLIPFMYVLTYLYDSQKAIPMAFGLSFAIGIFTFTIYLLILEMKENKGGIDD